jgi:hypothetical protein
MATPCRSMRGTSQVHQRSITVCHCEPRASRLTRRLDTQARTIRHDLQSDPRHPELVQLAATLAAVITDCIRRLSVRPSPADPGSQGRPSGPLPEVAEADQVSRTEVAESYRHSAMAKGAASAVASRCRAPARPEHLRGPREVNRRDTPGPSDYPVRGIAQSRGHAVAWLIADTADGAAASAGHRATDEVVRCPQASGPGGHQHRRQRR